MTLKLILPRLFTSIAITIAQYCWWPTPRFATVICGTSRGKKPRKSDKSYGGNSCSGKHWHG